MSDPTNSTMTAPPFPPIERRMAVPAKPGDYAIGEFRVRVRRRRAPSVWLRNERIRFHADQRGWSRTAFARQSNVDNSYTAPRIWNEATTRVTLPTAERICGAFDLPLAEIAHLDPQGEAYDPR